MAEPSEAAEKCPAEAEQELGLGLVSPVSAAGGQIGTDVRIGSQGDMNKH